MITVIVIAAVVVAYLSFTSAPDHVHHRYRKAAGLRPNFYWSSVRGPYASVRLPGGFRVGHRV